MTAAALVTSIAENGATMRGHGEFVNIVGTAERSLTDPAAWFLMYRRHDALVTGL